MKSENISLTSSEQGRRLYRTIWRWHFYAGVFCIPLVIWLACTGSIYLFKPQIERRLDRPYDHLQMSGTRAAPAQIALAAVAAVPGSILHEYELPPSDDSAVRVIVGLGTREFRVYVHPTTQAILHIVDEEKRPMSILFYLHGELLAGRWGSYLVELAASWAIVLILTGLYLWWPRQTENLAGVLWVRVRSGHRIFWRDLHAITGIWVSAFALFLILTGLPWATGWGSYFKKVRELTGKSATRQDWSTSHATDLAERAESNHNSLSAAEDMPDMPGMQHPRRITQRPGGPDAYLPFNRIVPIASSLNLAAPVEVVPAKMPDGPWTIRSDAQNRTLRDVLQVDPRSGSILSRQNFNQRLLLDRIVGTGVAAHEGQLFGPANQLLGLATAAGLITLCVSAIILWWRRRLEGVLGAPLPIGKPRWNFALCAAVVALTLYLPAMTVSLLLMLLAEQFIFPRWPRLNRWLGLGSVQVDQ